MPKSLNGSNLENLIAQAIAQKGPSSASQIAEYLYPGDPELRTKLSKVSVVLKRMEAKGLVKRGEKAERGIPYSLAKEAKPEQERVLAGLEGLEKGIEQALKQLKEGCAFSITGLLHPELADRSEEFRQALNGITAALHEMEEEGRIEGAGTFAGIEFYRIREGWIPPAPEALVQKTVQRTGASVENRVIEALKEGGSTPSDLAAKVFPLGSDMRARTSQVYVCLKRLEKKGTVIMASKDGQKTYELKNFMPPEPFEIVEEPVAEAPAEAPVAEAPQPEGPQGPAGPGMGDEPGGWPGWGKIVAIALILAIMFVGFSFYSLGGFSNAQTGLSGLFLGTEGGEMAGIAQGGQPNASEGKDTFILSGSPNQNNGNATELDLTGSDNRRILIYFNLSDIPSTATVTAANLTMYVTNTGAPPTAITYLHRLTRAWTEGTGIGSLSGDGATWNTYDGTNDWTTNGGDYDSYAWAVTNVTVKNVYVTWNITRLAQAWVSGNYSNYGMIIRTNISGSGTTTLASSDNANATIRPYLNITYQNASTDGAPSVTLVSPADGYTSSVNNVSFVCNSTDDKNLTNVTLYWNYSGAWLANTTVNTSGTLNTTNFTKTGLNNGTIMWNCRACDNASQCTYGTANKTVIISTGAPQQNTSTRLYFNGAQGNASFYAGDSVNITAALNVTGKTLYLSIGATNHTQSGLTPQTNISSYGTAGVFNITAWFPGDGGYTSSRVTYFMTILMQNTTTRLFFNGAEGNASVTANSQVNITADLSVPGKTMYLFFGMTNLTQGGTTPVSAISSYATTGTYNITAWFQQDSGYYGSSATRFLTITPQAEQPPGGGGGGGGSTIAPQTNVTNATTVQVPVPEGELKVQFLSDRRAVITGTNLQPKKYFVDLSKAGGLAFTSVYFRLTDVAPFFGIGAAAEGSSAVPINQNRTAYQYVRMDTSGNNNTFSEISINFDVKRSWLTENELDADDVRLYRYSNGWEPVETVIVKEQNDRVSYNCPSVPKFGYFAIAGTRSTEPIAYGQGGIIATLMSLFNTTAAAIMPLTTADLPGGFSPLLIVQLVIAAAAVVTVYVYKKRIFKFKAKGIADA